MHSSFPLPPNDPRPLPVFATPSAYALWQDPTWQRKRQAQGFFATLWRLVWRTDVARDRLANAYWFTLEIPLQILVYRAETRPADVHLLLAPVRALRERAPLDWEDYIQIPVLRQ